jgi:hypothetical protein
MASNISEFEMKLIRHYSAVELCEVLGITTEDLIDRFPELIEEFAEELREEIE